MLLRVEKKSHQEVNSLVALCIKNSNPREIVRAIFRAILARTDDYADITQGQHKNCTTTGRQEKTFQPETVHKERRETYGQGRPISRHRDLSVCMPEGPASGFRHPESARLFPG